MARWTGVAAKKIFARYGVAFPAITKGKLSGSILINNEEVKSKMMSMTVTRRVTVDVSTAIIVLANAKQEWTGKWTGGEVVKIYLDYSTGTTQIFEGRLFKTTSSYDKLPQLEVHASDYGQEAMDVIVFKKYSTATDIGQIADDLISEYLPGHTRANINTSTGVTATPEFQGKRLWDCLKELVRVYGSSNYEFYVDFAKDWHFFLVGSRQHINTSGIAAVYGQNLKRMSLDSPFTVKKNKITVIGNTIDGAPLISTKENTSDQSQFWVMHEIIKDSNLTTQAEVENKADKILTRKLTPGKTGKMTTDGLPGALPGYQIMTFEPASNINGYVTMTDVKHVMMGNAYRTEITFYETEPVPDDPIKQMAESIVNNEQKELALDNENGMENTYTFTFNDDTDIQSHSGTETSRGSLIVTSGKNVGTMITDTKVTDSNVTKGLLKVNGVDISQTKFEISNNGGKTYDTVEPDTLHTFSPADKYLKMKITLNTPITELKSMSLMYKK